MTTRDTVHGLTLEDLGQDVNDPVWESQPVDTAVDAIAGTEHPGVIRTVTGVLDTLADVAEAGADAWLDSEGPNSPGHKARRGAVRGFPPDVLVLQRSCANVRFTTYTLNISDGVQVLLPRSDRMRAVITNWGPGTVYLGHDSGSGLNEPQPNVAQIAAGASREVRASAAVWAFAQSGASPVVDVQDEYGFNESSTS